MFSQCNADETLFLSHDRGSLSDRSGQSSSPPYAPTHAATDSAAHTTAQAAAQGAEPDAPEACHAGPEASGTEHPGSVVGVGVGMPDPGPVLFLLDRHPLFL